MRCRSAQVQHQVRSLEPRQLGGTEQRRPSAQREMELHMASYLLTCNPSYWPDDATDHRFLAEQAERFRRGEALETSRWSTGARKKDFVLGDRLYLLVQGNGGSRGIIASGWVTDPAVVEHDAWEGAVGRKNYVDNIDWDAFVAREEALPLDALKVLAPSTYWNPQSSGTLIHADDSLAVAEAWESHLKDLGYAEEGAFSAQDAVSKGADIERRYVMAVRLVRRHQSAFRALLLRHQPNACAYCGLSTVALLEAAHIVGDAHGGAASLDNGILLCANHHRAFDKGLLVRQETGEFQPADGLEAEDLLPLPIDE